MVNGERLGVGNGGTEPLGRCASSNEVRVRGDGVQVCAGRLVPFGTPVRFGSVESAVFKVGEDPGRAGLGGVSVLVLGDQDAVPNEADGFLVEVLAVKVSA